MRVNARILPRSERVLESLRAAVPLDRYNCTSGRYAIPVGDDALQLAFLVADQTGGLAVSGEAVLSQKEIETLRFFEPLCRSTLRESDRDNRQNYERCIGTPLRRAGADEPIRIVQGLSLSRAQLRPNYVSGVGEWTGEYACGAAAVAAFAAAGLSGWSSVPILNTKTGQPYVGVAQLFCENTMRPCILDASFDRISSRLPEENGKIRQLGCFAYTEADLVAASDFNRTAEPWIGWFGCPSWVVSRRVRDVFRTGGLKGWHFRPVFTIESALYGEYCEAWSELAALVQASSMSKFEGGRW